MIDILSITQSVNLHQLILRDTEEYKQGSDRVYCPFCQPGGKAKSNSPAMKIKDGRFYCYGCGEHGDAIDYLQKRNNQDFITACRELGWNGAQPDRTELAKRQAEHEAKRLEAQRQHEAEVDRVLSALQTEDIIAGLQRRLTEEHRQWWNMRGVPREWQDYLKLGYVQDKPYYGHDGNLYHSTAYSIPYYHQNFTLKTIQYRLDNPQRPQDRYRFENGLPSNWYMTEPNVQLGSRLVICEGAIKAMVTRIFGIADLSISVVGVPAKAVWCNVEEIAKDRDRVWIILDPDGTKKAIELAKRIGKNARVVELPDKIDDALNSGMTDKDLANYLRYSRAVI